MLSTIGRSRGPFPSLRGVTLEVPESHVSLMAKNSVRSLSTALHLRLVSEKGCEREWECCWHPPESFSFSSLALSQYIFGWFSFLPFLQFLKLLWVCFFFKQKANASKKIKNLPSSLLLREALLVSQNALPSVSSTDSQFQKQSRAVLQLRWRFRGVIDPSNDGGVSVFLLW